MLQSQAPAAQPTTAIGSMILDHTGIDPSLVARAEAEAAESRRNPLQILVEHQLITPTMASEIHALSMGTDFVDLDEVGDIASEVIDLLEPRTLREHQIVPLRIDRGSLVVATNRLEDSTLRNVLRGSSGMAVRFVYADKAPIRRALDRFYSTTAEATRRGQKAELQVMDHQEAARQAAARVAGEGDVSSTLDVILDGAAARGATDVFFDCGEDELSIRYNVGGTIKQEMVLPATLIDRITGLIKTRAKLKSSALTNQDGDMVHVHRGVTYDIRVAVLPAVWGEDITLRFATNEVRPLEGLGFDDENFKSWKRMIASPNGLVLAVGPMGSGKTSVLMSTLNSLRTEDRKIVSLEKPVEVKFSSGITQVSINPEQGMDWNTAMGTVLRSAAKVMLVGEINQDEIAHTAIDAALTGHLVFSTLHTNDAMGSIVRLREMGIRPSVLADSIRGIVAQRLPRTLCNECKLAAAPNAPEVAATLAGRRGTRRWTRQDEVDLGRLSATAHLVDGEVAADFSELADEVRLCDELRSDGMWFRPSPDGCRECYGTGYDGRQPIHEMFVPTRATRQAIMADVSNMELFDVARQNGLRTLREEGIKLAASGATDLAEIIHHTLSE